MKRYRQHPAESHTNQERWLLTYADMITLLTAFFLMLYSMSVMSKGKFTRLASSVRGSFHGVSPGGGKLLPHAGVAPNNLGLTDGQNTKYRQAMRELRQFVEQKKLMKDVSSHTDERGTVISLVSDNMLFERGKADLRQDSKPVLDHVAQILQAVPNNIAIEGHTCDLPIHTAQFPSNWELSSSRAGTILRDFTDRASVPSYRFMAAGYADTRPITPNRTEADRIRNRRVDIVILKTSEQRQQDAVRQAEVRRITVPGAADAVPTGDNSAIAAQPETGQRNAGSNNTDIPGRQGNSIREP